ncbi:MAG: chorismate mutase [Polyangiaceae bacterium]|nr:chorismate mutase [Myxococcales bacterium]MCB9585515.1 chorismate mutase [Polyangiaceae bacterium]MCB9606469.1 chorismate mutase [Polyangiaceae bacterium]
MDPELAELRDAIDALDREILELVARRVEVVLRVGDFKRARNLRVYDPARERDVLDKLSAACRSPLTQETVRRIFERLIDESRRLEQVHVSQQK